MVWLLESTQPWVAFPFRDPLLTTARVPSVNTLRRLEGLHGSVQWSAAFGGWGVVGLAWNLRSLKTEVEGAQSEASCGLCICQRFG